MSRSRSFNRFHRYLARQKRRGLRSVLPQFQMDFEIYGSPIDHSRDMLNRLRGREVELELLDAEAPLQRSTRQYLQHLVSVDPWGDEEAGVKTVENLELARG